MRKGAGWISGGSVSGREKSICTGFETGGCLVFLKKCIKVRVAEVEGASRRAENEVTKV